MPRLPNRMRQYTLRYYVEINIKSDGDPSQQFIEEVNDLKVKKKTIALCYFKIKINY